jgi:phage gpG-like protein
MTDDITRYYKRVGERLGTQGQQALLASVARRVAAAVEESIPGYPTPSGKPLPLFYTRTRADGSTYRSKFKTMKQQRYVFAMIAKGKIPYTRTGTLGRSITTKTEATATEATIQVGTNVPYAPYVISSVAQSNYHKGTWWTLEGVVDTSVARYTQVTERAVERYARELLDE